MGRAAVFADSAAHVAAFLPLFAELERRGETVSIHGSAAGAADYLLVDADADWAVSAARRTQLPAVGLYAGLAHPEGGLDWNLVLIARALQPGAERFGEHYRFVGHLADESSDGIEPDWRELGPDPLIYVSPGECGELLRAVRDAFAGLPFELVVDAGAKGAARRRLLDRATLSISTAEPAVVEECAAADVPQLLFPSSRDALLLADHVQQLGAGARLQDDELGCSRLRARAGRVMADPGYCRAAMALGESVRATGGAAAACDEMLAFVRRTTR